MKSKFAVVLLIVAMVAQMTFAAAATAPVNTKARIGMRSQYGVYTNTIIYAGSIVCLNSSGYAVAGADASGNLVVGKAAETVDNRTNASGAGDSGALKINVDRGVFGWAVSGVSKTDIGSLAYVLDSQTVTNASAGNAIIAGTIVDYSDSLAWVDTFNIGRTAGSYTTLSASGASSLQNVAVSGTMKITGVQTNSSTISATQFKTVDTAGLASRIVTNSGTGYTNLITITGGIVTAVTTTGTP